MSETVIQVQNLSKQYRLGVRNTGTISHDLNRWWAKVRGKEDPFAKVGEVNDRTKAAATSEYVWALKDINFEIKKGEVLGVIGRNGAGKSTLLKLLSKVTRPTTGTIKMKGRVASLLEVGTGFHPELTGRENVFLNGAILGMTKVEIKKKFDEIIEFAGVERYVDTPVKRYSSGMYVRLAFAVAAHLEPEILIVDEVLAVGDAEFQKKCLGKMNEVSKEDGRTILFVSHNMGAIKGLCNSGLLLEHGTVALIDKNIEHVVGRYLSSNHLTNSSSLSIKEREDRKGNGVLRVVSIELVAAINNAQIESGKPLGFKIGYEAKLNTFSAKVLISINNEHNETIVFLDSETIADFPGVLRRNGKIEVYLSDGFGLPKGQYFINVAILVNGTMADHIVRALHFTVVDGIFYSNGKVPRGRGLCYVKQKWRYECGSYDHVG